ncbi:hypothetical protein EV175_002110 [Coemansia sp. RSA 1933]|nr:hypothetical protein EV175_002110 [Coemansia sp. RSA 1933]
MAFDVIGSLGFGRSFGIVASGNTQPIDAAYKTLTLGILKATLPFGDTTHLMFRDLVDARDYSVKFATMAIEQRRMDISRNGGEPEHKDVLQRLVDARDPLTSQPLDVGSVTAEISLMLLAGTGTVTYLLTWILLHLLYNREAYNRLTSQIRSVFPNTNVLIRYDNARRMLPYLTAVIYESMRMRTVVSNYMPRRVPAIGGASLLDGKYRLPPGTEIDVSLSAWHRNPGIWENPHTFNPARFMGSNAEDRIKDVLWFSSGVRICVGRYLALAEVYNMLANILRRYDFHLPQHLAQRHPTIADIPSSTFFNQAPQNPERDCMVLIRHACQLTP